jgi:hypothetical protein
VSPSSTRVLAACAAFVAIAMGAVGNPAAAEARPFQPRAGCGTDWQIVPSPNLGTKSSILRGVAAVSATDVWAVGVAGGQSSGLPFRPLIEHWDGASWAVVPAAKEPRGSAELRAVHAISSNDVWAVGDSVQHLETSPERTLVEHWDGTRWSIVKSVDVGPGSNSFSAVAATSSNDVWAAGAAFGPAQRRYKPLAEHWDGTAWTVYGPPFSPSGDNVVNGMTEISSGDVWAVGEAGKSGERRPLTEHWDGSSWTRVPTGTPGDNFLLGASASSTSDVWAVGYRYTDAGSAVPLSEHWDGAAWSFVSTPHPSPYFDTLSGVVALSPSDAWAVGSNPIRPRNQQPLIERWDGTAWSIVPGPTGPKEANQLGAIAADPDGDLWAVGFSQDIAVENAQTLIERRCPS